MGPKKRIKTECAGKTVKTQIEKGRTGIKVKKEDSSKDSPLVKRKAIERVPRVTKRKSDEIENNVIDIDSDLEFVGISKNKRLKNVRKQSPANPIKQNQVKKQVSKNVRKQSPASSIKQNQVKKQVSKNKDIKNLTKNATRSGHKSPNMEPKAIELVPKQTLFKSKQKEIISPSGKVSRSACRKGVIQKSKTKEKSAITNTLVSPMKIKKDTDLMNEVDSSSSESEWEDVAEEPTQDIDDYKPIIPDEGVEITLEGPTMPRKRQKKAFDMMEYIRLEINRGKKGQQLVVHQVHLLCLLARGIFMNDILASDDMKALGLSLIPIEFFEIKADKVDIEYIRKLVNWFRSSFIVDENFKSSKTDVKKAIYKCFEHHKVSSQSEFNLIFIVIARSLCLNVRFCLSLYPLTFKAPDLLKKSKFGDQIKKKENTKETEGSISNEVSSKPGSSKDTKTHAKKSTKPIQESKITVKKQKNSLEKPTKKCITKRIASKRSARKSYQYSNDEDGDDVDADEDYQLKEDSSDDELKKQKRPPKTPVKAKKSNRKILSSDCGSSSPETVKYEEGINYWLEVFCKKEAKWFSVECYNNIINKPYEIERKARQPVTYVVCYDNFSYLKDVTKRYSAQWMTLTRKLRVAHDWWLDALEPFLPPNTKQDRDEESQMEANLLRKPMPSTISEFKNHPLYALKRHLLKFQAIYPADAPSIGFVRGEPVYARECVHALHSRETWLKEARLVRVKEEPYKIVKARPKWNRLTGSVTTDLPLNLYGRWQTEDYMPPIAWNGKVPRNEYGNVELFKPCMLPIGTVHLRNAGLNRIAKKLNIDCSPAVVGFDGHKGSIHPVFDGFIVCEEFKDTILAAWEEEQVNIRKREIEKREKRVYGNWKKLIKGLLIRERLKAKYDLK